MDKKKHRLENVSMEKLRLSLTHLIIKKLFTVLSQKQNKTIVYKIYPLLSHINLFKKYITPSIITPSILFIYRRRYYFDSTISSDI